MDNVNEEMNPEKEAYMAWLLSQMVDGELNRQQVAQMVRVLSKNPRLKSKWRTWHLVREVLESEEILLHAKQPLQTRERPAQKG